MPETSTMPPVATPRVRVALLLSNASDWIDTHGSLSLVLMLFLYLLAALGYSLASPLWHDELFTLFIAQAPSFHELFAQTRTIDLNPPLSYLLTRASLHLFGTGTLQTRLPEILGFVLAQIGIYLFVRRRLGSAYGVLAAAFLFASTAGLLSIQARPYGLLLGFSALSLAAWQSAAEKPTLRNNLLLLLALAALLLTHVFGIFVWASILAAELLQTIQSRKPNLPRLLAMILPLAAIAFYLPILRNHGQSVFPEDFQVDAADIAAFYILHTWHEITTLIVTSVLLLLCGGRTWLRSSSRSAFTAPERLAVAGLIFGSLAIMLRLMHDHGAFFDRYGVTAIPGIAVAATAFLSWKTANRPAAALVATVIILLLSGSLRDALTHPRVFRHTEPTVYPAHLDALDPSIPLVASSGLTFIEMNHRESPQVLAHTFYLTGGDAAIQYAHATIFESMDYEVRAFRLRGSTEPYTRFIAEHPHFYVFGTIDFPEDWLLRKLQADGAQITRVATIGGSYRDEDLYEIRTSKIASR